MRSESNINIFTYFLLVRGSVRGYKIPKYGWLFSKNTDLPSNFFQNTDTETFSASQAFACISRQPELNSFKIYRTIKYMFFKNVIYHTTYDFLYAL